MKHRLITSINLNYLTKRMNSRLLILLGLFLFGSTAVLQGQGNIIYVDASATAGGDGQSWATAYNDLKDALALGNYQAGDVVWVAAGTYYPTTGTDRDSTFQLRNNLALLGGFLPGDSLLSQRNWSTNTTILSGDIGTANDTSDNSYHVVSGWFGDSTAILDGFTITGGNANGGGWVNGGGMWNFSSPGFTGPLVKNCSFKLNYARNNGGAVYNYENSATLDNCWFENNVANEGGAIFNGTDASSIIVDCFFGQDSARAFGGAIHANLSEPTILNCRFEANHANFFGGAINFLSNPSAQIINCEFRGNTSAGNGGAIYIETASALKFYNCLISGNLATQNGGGVYTTGISSTPTFTNCTIAYNRSALAGGIDIKVFSMPVFQNTIVYGNRTSSGSSNHFQQINGSSLMLNNCIVENLPNGLGVNTLSSDPLFLSTPTQTPPTSQGDYRVETNSPAIDSGSAAFLPMDVFDLDGDGNVTEALPVDIENDQRLQNLQVDIGAYETFSLCAGGNINLITPDTTFICEGDSFTAYPGHYSSYLWYNGSVDTSVTIDSAGLYWVEVTDPNGCSFRDTFWVEQNPTPDPDIEPLIGTTVCRGGFIGLRAKFTSSLFSSPTYTWSNGAILTATNRIQYFYPDTLVWVEITSQYGCVGRDTFADPITFFPLPNPDLGPDTLNLCEGQSTTLDAGPFLFGSYKWQAGSSTIPGATSQTLVVDSTNRYIVTVVDSNLCTNDDTIQVVFNANPQLDSIMPSQNIVICSGDSVTLDAGNFDSYLWSTSATTPTINVSQPGFYGVRVSNIFGCTDTATSQVLVNTSPIAFIDTVQGTLICPNDSISLQANGNVTIQSYNWSTGDTTRNIFVTKSGTYKVTITDVNGCDAEAEVVTRAAPLLNPNISVIFQGGSSVFCEGDTISLDAGVGIGSSASYRWSTTETTPRIRVTNGGIYWVEVTAPNGCIERDTTMNLFRFPTPNPTITGNNQVLCTGDTLVLGVSPAFPNAILRWTGNVFAQTLDVTAGGSYSVTITDAVGCVGSDTAIVSQVPTPTPQIDTLGAGITTFCEGDSVTLDGGVFSAYIWSGGQGGTTRFLTAKTTDQYILTVIDANQCEGRDTVNVTVHPNPVLTLAVQDTNAFCEGDSATILASMHPFYQWSTGETGSKITVDSSGTYLLLVSDNNGCIALDSARITVHPNPTPTFVPANPFVCIGDTTVLAVTPTYQSYNWTGGFTTSFVSLDQGGWVQVSVTDLNTCETTDSVFVDQFNKPLPVISSSITSVCEGDTVGLSADSGYVSYLWSTGDTTQSIQVTLGGIYWVQVMDANGCPGRDSLQVTILPNPTPSIIPFGRTDLCQGDSVILSSDTFYTFYNWNTGANTQSIVAKTAGKYWLEVTDANGCKGADSLDISVSNFLEPMIQVSGGSTTICDGDSVNLLLGTYDTYAWGMGMDTTVISRNNSIKIGTSGSYWVQVTTSNGCSGNDTVMITVVPQLTPMITASGPLTFCEGDSVILDAGGPYANYRWNGNNSLNTQILVAKTTGNYLVEVTDGNGCQGISSRFVRVFPNPTQGITPNRVGNNFCDGDTVQLYGGNSAIYPSIVWSTGSNNDTIFVTRTGLFSVTITDTNGCSIMDSIQLNFFANPQPTITGGGPLVVCQGDSLTLNAGTYASYLWSTGVRSSSIHVTQGGQYFVTVVDANGCEGSDSVRVTKGLPPEVNISPPGPVFLCPDRSQILDAGNYAAFRWSTGDTTRTINVLGRDSGLYHVTVVDTNGCEARDSIQISAYAVDTVQIVANPNVLVACSADSLTLSAVGNFSTYQWSTGDSTMSILPPPDPNDLPRVYTVFVTDDNGCQDIGVTVVTIKQTTFASFTGLDTAYCDNDTALVPLTGTPPGFSFLGPGINPGGNFRPSDAGPGQHDILYTLTSSNGCEDTARFRVTVFPVGGSPSFMLDDTLCNNQLLNPLIATPIGGTFSGPGVFQDNGIFKLAADSLLPNNTYTVTYGYGVVGLCFNQIQDSFYVKPVTTASLTTTKDSFCLRDGPGFLTAAPAGGILSCATCGNGLLQNQFIPDLAGPGLHEVIYVTFNGDCPDTARITLTVSRLPSLNIANPDTVFCEGEAPVALQATPAGGTFLGGPYIQGTQFNPSPLFTTPGVNTVSYFFVDPNTGCTNLTSKDFIVNPLPPVSILSPGLQSFCPDGNPIALSATPPGGAFSGVGMRDSNIFDPVLADTGIHEIIYTFTDTNSCTNEGKISLSVNAIIGMGFAGLDSSYCQGQGQIDLTTVTTPVSGGIKSFFGPPVLNNRLLSTNRPPSTYTIGYIYTDLSTPAQCKDTLYTQVRLDTIPRASFLTADGRQLSDAFCFSGGLATTLQGFPSMGGDSRFLGIGIKPPRGASSVVYDPSLAGLGTDTVAYIFTDNNGCADTAVEYIDIMMRPNADILVYNDTDVVSFCLGDTISQVFTGTPANGQFWNQPPDTNIFVPTGFFTSMRFDPVVFGPGRHALQYIYDTQVPGCRDSSFLTAYVFDKQDAVFDKLEDGYCVTDSINILLSAIPDVGSRAYLINGVEAQYFNPKVVGIGTHIVGFAYEIEGCPDTLFKTVVVRGQPTVSFSGLDSIFCSDGETVNLTGMPEGGRFFGDGIVGSSNIFDPTNASTGSQLTVQYAYVDGFGCTDTASLTTIVYPTPQAQISVTGDVSPDPFFLCLNEDIIFTSPVAGNFDYFWDINEEDSSTMKTVRYRFDSPGLKRINHVLTLQAGGCSDTISENIFINPLPEAIMQGDSIIFLGDQAQYMNLSDEKYDFEWLFSDSLIMGMNPVSYFFSDTGYQDVMLAIEDTVTRCTDTTTFQSLVIFRPKVEFVQGLFPNPTKGEVNVNIRADAGVEIEIHVFDATGRFIFKESYPPLDSGLNRLKIDLTGLADGFYGLLIMEGDERSDFGLVRPSLFSRFGIDYYKFRKVILVGE